MIIWLYGKPYSGKTTFASQFPNAYFISLDKNAQFLTDNYVNVSNINDYSKAIKDFMNDPKEYETLVIDTIDLLEQYVRSYYLDKFGIEDESDRDDFGKAWRLVREGTFQAILKATAFEGNVIFISHEDETVTKNAIGKEISNFAPGINKKLHSRIAGLTTLIGRAYKDSKKVSGQVINRYFISFGSNSEELSGTRLQLKDNLIENNYEEFVKIIGKA